MKTLKTIVLPVAAVFVIAMTLSSSLALADMVPGGAGPSNGLSVYFLKKSFDFCDDALDDHTGDIPGGAVPYGSGDMQSAGCVDLWSKGLEGDGREQARVDNYAFTGEQIAELIVARDLSGAEAITHAIMKVDGSDVVYCSEIPGYDVGHMINDGVTWKGHDVSQILTEFPPQVSEGTYAGYDQRFDKVFQCFMQVTDGMSGLSPISIEVRDEVNDLDATTADQMWYFNPEVSLDISLSDGSALTFEDGYAGDLVYSTNSLMLENSADGGVDIAVWLGGTDLTSPDMAAKCPYTNALDVENAMEFRCTLDNGIYVEQCWQPVKNPNVKEECEDVSYADKENECLALEPLFSEADETCAGTGHDNILKNGHEAECQFKLEYPVPCIGDFTDGNLIILMRAI